MTILREKRAAICLGSSLVLALVALVLGALLVFTPGCNRGTEAPAYAVAAEPRETADGAGAPTVGAEIGSLAPDFALRDLDGRVWKLSDQRGKVVLLNFWATWCGPCRIEMPTIEALSQDLKGQPFQVLAVAGDFDGAKKVAPFMAQIEASFPALLDANGAVQDLYYANRLPMTFVIGKDGVIKNILVGFFDWHLDKYRRLITARL
ncbi:MAG: TlpA family protein disulfide reductase [Nitrospirota bacterium]|nr:TlpA family protein disulfide reductase [Nitrospirota bacterium]